MGPQHSQSLESWFMHIPGIKIAIPSNAADAYGLMRTALLDNNPVLFVENVRLYGRRADVDTTAEPIPFGQARIVRERPRRHGRRALGHGRRGARGRRPARGARHLGRGDRPAHAGPARHGHDPRRRYARRCASPSSHDAHRTLRLRRGDRRALHGGGVRLPRRAGRARGRARTCRSPARRAAIEAVYPRRQTTWSRQSSGSSHDRRDVAAALDLDGGRQGGRAGSSRTETRSARASCSSRSRPTRRRSRSRRPPPACVRIVAAEGAIVPVEGVLAELQPAAPGAATAPPAEPAASPRPSRRRARAPARGANGAVGAGAGARVDRSRRLRPAVSPRERGVDLAVAAARGPGGRIVARDRRRLRRDLARRSRLRPRRLTASGEAVVREHHRQLAADPARPHRRRARRRGPRAGARGRRSAGGGATVTDLLIVALARALAEVPELNGCAASTARSSGAARSTSPSRSRQPAGVVAPVIRDADRGRSTEVAQERGASSTAARLGTLEGRDLGGGTCTLSNLGAYPVDFFAPVVSGPQVAMVATGRIVEKVVAVDGADRRPAAHVGQRRHRPSRSRRRGGRSPARRARAPDRTASRRAHMTIAPGPGRRGRSRPSPRRARRRGAARAVPRR